MKYLSMKDVTDVPVHHQLVDDLWTESSEKRKDILRSVANEVVLMYSDIEACFDNQTEMECDEVNSQVHINYDDKVQSYASGLLFMGLIYLEFSDAIREGDGLRILRCWWYLMLIFKAAQRKNYSIEVLNLLSQYHFFLTHRQAEQLIWSRCVNTLGRPGKNIPSDLFMEHLNRICKMAIGHIGANKTSESIKRAAKCLGILAELLAKFNNDLGIECSGNHPAASINKDKNIILKQLLEEDVFGHVDKRKHSCFANNRRNIISGIKKKALYDWIRDHLKRLKSTLYYT